MEQCRPSGLKIPKDAMLSEALSMEPTKGYASGAYQGAHSFSSTPGAMATSCYA